MKISVSDRLDQTLLSYLDGYQQAHHIRSRSEALERAIRALRELQLKEDTWERWLNGTRQARIVAGIKQLATGSSPGWRRLVRRGDIYLTNLDPSCSS